MAAAAPFHTAVLTLLSSSLCHHHPLWLGHTPAYPALRLGSPERTGHCPGGDDGGKRGAEEVGGYSGLHSPLSPGLTHGPRLTFTVFLPPQQSWAHTTRSLQAHSSSRASQTRLPSSEEPGPLHPCKLASSRLPDKLRPPAAGFLVSALAFKAHQLGARKPFPLHKSSLTLWGLYPLHQAHLFPMEEGIYGHRNPISHAFWTNRCSEWPLANILSA